MRLLKGIVSVNRPATADFASFDSGANFAPEGSD
jgi:hypothetical protein